MLYSSLEGERPRLEFDSAKGSICSFAQLWLWSAERIFMTFLFLLAVSILSQGRRRERAVVYWAVRYLCTRGRINGFATYLLQFGVLL